MNDEPMMIDETEDFAEPRRGARRSWKIFQLVVAGLLTLFVVTMMLADRWDGTFGADTKADIAEFERAQKEYFSKVKERGLAHISMETYSPLAADVFGRAMEQEVGTYEARERLQGLVSSMNYGNKDKAEAGFTFSARLHNKGTVTIDEMAEYMSAEAKPWVMRSITAGLWLALKTAAITFVAAWLLLKLCELFWWFFIDRLRDVADAVRKS